MKRRLAGLLVLLLVASCVATVGYPERREDTAVRMRVENQHSGMGIIVVRVMCEGVQVQAIRDVPLNTNRVVRLRGNAASCGSGLYVRLTDVTGRVIHWQSQTVPVGDGARLAVVMGATLNLSTFYPLP